MCIITSDAQKQMVESAFGHKFWNLNYFEVGVFFHISNNHMFNITYLHTTLHRILKYVDFSWIFFVIVIYSAL